jgi:hypothetical protein
VHPRQRANRIITAVVVAVLLIAAVTLILVRRRAATGWFAIREVRVTSDEGFVYLLLQTEGRGTPDWNRALYRIAIDTYDSRRGERSLPQPYAADIPTGAEFLLDIGGPEASSLRVTPDYNPYPHKGEIAEGRAIGSPKKPSGTFVPLQFETNRERFGRDGKRFPSLGIDRGKLHFLKSGDDARTNLQADIAAGEQGAVEVRIPWGLLNVSDPSTRRVLDGVVRSEESEATQTEGFRFYVYAFDRRKPGAQPADRFPGTWRAAPLFTWQTWDEPKYKLEMKESARAIAATMKELNHVGKQ